MKSRVASVLLLLLVYLGTPGPLQAQEGRFQAIAIDSGLEYGTEKALILDTYSGHLWIWVESPAVNDEPGGRYLIYQGQLEPGKTMGQVMDRQEWEVGPGE